MAAGVKLQVEHMFKRTTQWHAVDREQGISGGHPEFFFRNAKFSLFV